MVITANPPKFDKRQPSKGGYDAIVYIDGSEVVAEDSNGRKIASGVAGTDDVSVAQLAISATPARGTCKIAGQFTWGDNTLIADYKKNIDLTGSYIDNTGNTGAAIEVSRSGSQGGQLTITGGFIRYGACGIKLKGVVDVTLNNVWIQEATVGLDYDGFDYGTWFFCAKELTIFGCGTGVWIRSTGSALANGFMQLGGSIRSCYNGVIIDIGNGHCWMNVDIEANSVSGITQNVNTHPAYFVGGRFEQGVDGVISNGSGGVIFIGGHYYNYPSGAYSCKVYQSSAYPPSTKYVSQYPTLQAAVDALVSGDTLIFPYGVTYVENITATSKHNITIIGNKSTIAPSTGHALDLSGYVTGWKISDLTFKADTGSYDVYLRTGARDHMFERCVFGVKTSNTPIGIYYEAGSNYYTAGKITNCTFTAGLDIALEMMHSGSVYYKYLIFDKNIVSSTNGLYLSKWRDCIFSDNIFNCSGYALTLVNTPQYNHFVNNDVVSGTLVGIIGNNVISNQGASMKLTNSDSSTGTGSEQTIAHGLAEIPTGCKAWITYLVGTRYVTEMIPFDATNVYPTVDNGVAYTWRIE